MTILLEITDAQAKTIVDTLPATTSAVFSDEQAVGTFVTLLVNVEIDKMAKRLEKKTKAAQ